MKLFGKLTLSQKGLSLIGLLLILELSFVGTLGYLLYEAEAASRYESNAQEVISLINKFILLAVRVNYYENRYLGTNNEIFARQYHELVPSLKDTSSKLIKHARAFPSCVKVADKIEQLFNDWFTIEERLVWLQSTRQYPAAGQLRKSKTRIGTERIPTELHQLQKDIEPARQQSMAAHLRSRNLLMEGLWTCVVLNILAAVAISLAFMRGIANRLDILVDNTRRLAEDRALNPQSTSQDEIGKLDAVFHQMSRNVREAARKERSLIDNSREVICSLNAQYKFQKVSPAAITNWEYEPASLIGHEVRELIVDSERQNFLQSLTGFQKQEPHVNLESRMFSRTGRLIDTVWSMHWSDADACFFSVVHDMSDRKRAEDALRKSEARVRTILNSMLVGLLTVNEDGTIESANPRIEQMLLYNAEELSGTSQSILFPNLKFADLRRVLEVSRNKPSSDSADSRAVHKADIAARRKNGDLIPVELWMTEMESIEGKRYLINLVDVTARHAIEQAKEEFVAMISHDLRTPLSSVFGFLELLEDGSYGNLNTNGQNRAGMALRNVERLLRLINDLLEINKLESGQLELHCQTVSLDNLVQRAVESVHFFAAQHKVQLDYSPCETKLFVDGDRLERVLINLLSNAIKFSPEGEKVVISVDVSSDPLTIKVIDCGRGIPEAHKELIFERFRQVSTTDATQKGGTGLGLAICRAVIEQHGGTIGVDSTEGKGSAFWIQLPKIAAEAAVSVE